MIKNQWYAVLSSHQIKSGKVTAAKRFGQNLIFFRTSTGELVCLNSLCAHRGASLAKGCVNNDHIQCPFHGIEYDSTGKCVHIPSEGKGSKEDYSRFHLIHYPVSEIGGIVFIWYGDKDPIGEPDYFDVMTDPAII